MIVGAAAGPVVHRLAHYAVAGTIGSIIVKGATALRPRVAPVTRKLTVQTLAAGIVAGRKVGEVTEEARLKAGDMLAEAHASLGDPAPAPAAHDIGAAHGHEH